MALFDPLFPEIPATTLAELADGYIWQNSFVETPFQRYMAYSGAYDPFGGGADMQVPSIYAPLQGGALAPGQSVTLTRKQIITASVFDPKFYSYYTPIEEFELEVLNRGPNARVGILETYLEQLIQGLDFQLEADMFRHGQAIGAGVADDRTNSINGMSEAINDGVTPSWDGNYFPTYGSSTRNGALGASINSTPVWFGDASGNPAPPSYQQLLDAYLLAIGRPNFMNTSWKGYAAIASAFQRQQRYDTRDDHNINWSGIKFEDATIFYDDITPCSTPKPSIANLANPVNAIATLSYVQTAGMANNINNLPATLGYTSSGTLGGLNTVVVGEPIWMLDVESWKYRPAVAEKFNYFFMDPIRWPDNPTMYSQFLRHSMNWYTPTPRRNIAGYGILG